MNQCIKQRSDEVAVDGVQSMGNGALDNPTPKDLFSRANQKNKKTNNYRSRLFSQIIDAADLTFGKGEELRGSKISYKKDHIQDQSGKNSYQNICCFESINFG